jgi:hypothetical protein
MKTVLQYGLPIALTIYALFDCAQADESHVKTLPKWGWLLLIILVGFPLPIGPIAYLIAGRNKPKGRKAPKRRILPPDDDPDFLGKL